MVTSPDEGESTLPKPEVLTALEGLVRRDPVEVAKMLVDVCWIAGAVELGSEDAQSKLERLLEIDDATGKIVLVLRYPTGRRSPTKPAGTDSLLKKMMREREPPSE